MWCPVDSSSGTTTDGTPDAITDEKDGAQSSTYDATHGIPRRVPAAPVSARATALPAASPGAVRDGDEARPERHGATASR